MPILQENDILLRPLSDSDKYELARLANNKKIWDNVRDYFPFPYTESHAENFIMLLKSENPEVTFAIEYQRKLAGVIGLVPQNDVYRKTAEIGYWIGEQFWGKGIATAATKLITQYGLYELDFARLHTGVFEYNIASMKVLEKCGYKKDGIFEKAVFKNKKLWDEHRYSKIK